MKLAATALVLLFSLALPEAGFATTTGEQTDWYSRGIIRHQTIKMKTAQKKRQQYLKRKKRRAHTVRHRVVTKPANVVKN
jgi:hypothetical protein